MISHYKLVLGFQELEIVPKDRDYFWEISLVCLA